MVSLQHYLVLGAILFAISVVGIFLNRKNVIILLMAIELMLLAVNMNFIAFSHYLGNPAGQIFVLQIDQHQAGVAQPGWPQIGAGEFKQGFWGGHIRGTRGWKSCLSRYSGRSPGFRAGISQPMAAILQAIGEAVILGV